MTLPTAEPVMAVCPECGDVPLETISNKNTPDMHHAFKQVNLQRCPKCGIEVTITTTIDIVKPIAPQRKVGLYIPPGVKLPKGYGGRDG